MGGATAKKLSPLWYVIDSWPIMRAPQQGSGTENKNHNKFITVHNSNKIIGILFFIKQHFCGFIIQALGLNFE